jgi:hypothetical protein
METDHWGVPGVGRRITLRYLQEVGSGVWTGIELAQDRGRWRELVNAVIKLRVL